ncbi:hypothetical protein OAQ84_01355 [Bdellovibrionales bacterium]|nr:hypothetical protein [Bdellovibrionales bacterium]
MLRKWSEYSRGHFVLAAVTFFPILFGGYGRADTLKVGLEQSLFVTESFSEHESDSYTRFFSSYNFGRSEGTHDIYGDLRWAVIDGKGVDQILAAPQLYYHISSEDEAFQFEVGRVKKNWSQLDQFWGLGIWQPTLSWGDVLTEQQGLTGIFLSMKVRRVLLMGFVSGIYLPSQGVSAGVENGKVISQDRWYNEPISQLEFSGESSDIFYELGEVDQKKIVSQWSYGFQLRIGKIERSGWLQASISSKPMSQLYIGVSGSQDLSEGSRGLSTVVKLYPIVARHQVGSIEAGYSGEDLTFWSSMTYEQPEEPKIDQRWIKTPLLNTTVVGFYIGSRDLPFHLPGKMSLGYLKKMDEGRVVKKDLIEGVAENAFEKIPYDEAWAMGWGVTPGNWRFQKWGVNFRYLFAPTVKGSLLSGAISYATSEKWSGFFKFDIVGSQSSEQSDYFYRNQGNDRLQAGVTHVF